MTLADRIVLQAGMGGTGLCGAKDMASGKEAER